MLLAVKRAAVKEEVVGDRGDANRYNAACRGRHLAEDDRWNRHQRSEICGFRGRGYTVYVKGTRTSSSLIVFPPQA